MSAISTGFWKSSRLETKPATAHAAVWTGAAAMVAGMSFLESFTGTFPSIQLGVQLYPQDFLCAFLGALFLAGAVHARRISLPVAILLALTALASMQTIRGMFVFGPAAAGNEARNTAYFLAAALCFGTAPANVGQRVLKVFAIYAIALALLAVGRWAILAFVPSLALWGDVGGGREIRVLNGAQTLLLCQSALLAGAWLLVRGRSTRIAITWIVIAAAAVIVLQQRSVWIAGAAGLAWLLARTYTHRTESWRRGIGIACIIVAAAAIIAAIAGGLSSEFLTSLTEPTDPHSTLAWRIKGWEILLTQPTSMFEWIFGCVFGTGYLRMIDGSLRDEAPHNFYLQTLLRCGALGVGLLVAAYGVLLAKARRRESDLSFAPIAAEMILVTQLVFFVAYSPTIDQGVLLGLATMLVAQSRNSNRKLFT